MLLALFFLANLTDWVPMRWFSNNAATLRLLDKTPVNCLLLEKDQWNPPMVKAGREKQLALLGVIRPGEGAESDAAKVVALKLDGVVLEGDFDPALTGKLTSQTKAAGLLAIHLPPRSKMNLANPGSVLGTTQGVWPGIEVDEGSAKAAPSGGPWINTNTGFLRFLRASTTSPVWMANRPPDKQVVTTERYMQAVSDAAVVGARWVVSLDPALAKRLADGDELAAKEWTRIAGIIGYFEGHPKWRSLQPAGQLALVQDAGSGALFSGGILDMIAVKHTPVRAVPAHELTPALMKSSQMAINVDPASLTNEQKQVLREFTRAGGTLLNGPPGWKFPAITADRITLGDEDVHKLDEIWKEVNTMTGRRNLGVRLFNVSSMLSSFERTADGNTTVLHLVNYSDYPVEAVAVHLLERFTAAKLITPDGGEKVLKPYEVEEGIGIDIDLVRTVATLVLEK